MVHAPLQEGINAREKVLADSPLRSPIQSENHVAGPETAGQGHVGN